MDSWSPWSPGATHKPSLRRKEKDHAPGLTCLAEMKGRRAPSWLQPQSAMYYRVTESQQCHSGSDGLSRHEPRLVLRPLHALRRLSASLEDVHELSLYRTGRLNPRIDRAPKSTYRITHREAQSCDSHLLCPSLSPLLQATCSASLEAQWLGSGRTLIGSNPGMTKF